MDTDNTGTRPPIEEVRTAHCQRWKSWTGTTRPRRSQYSTRPDSPTGTASCSVASVGMVSATRLIR